MQAGTDTKKKTRAGGSRSRGGCQTCRIRRVKCDETKPGCIRCEKFGRVCDGYEITRKTSYNPPEPPPRLVTRNRSLQPITLAPATPSPSFPPTTIRFQGEQDERYFHLFHTETCGALSGGFDTPLWSRIVLQACHDEPCILHCTIALSALDKACKARINKSLANTAEVHHRYALMQYGKALQGAREVICTRQDSLRTTLIAALLIFCFENFHGDIRLALTNVRSAVELVHEWLASNATSTTPIGFSPAPDIVEDELVSAFSRLDVHLMSWIDTPPPPRNTIMSCAIAEPRTIPSAFHSLRKAKSHFEYLVTRIFGYLANVSKYKNRASASPRSDSSDRNGTSSGESEELFHESVVAQELSQWMSAFDPVLRHARTIEGDQDFEGATTLRIHVLTLQLSLRSAFFEKGNQDLFDLFLPEFCEIVALCRDLVEHARFVKSFIFDSGIVPSLFVVVTKCRDRMLRQEAIEVLKAAGPRREGVWDSLMVARIGEELIGIEEEEAKGKSPVDETSKRKWVEIHLQCLSMTFNLPMPREEGGKSGSEGRYADGRGFLLDWVERSMRMNALAG